MMQFSPANIDVEAIAQRVDQISGVKNIHHVHIWQINEHDIMFEAHIDLDKDLSISRFENILSDVKKFLKGEYHIHHVTLQPEFSITDNKTLIKN